MGGVLITVKNGKGEQIDSVHLVEEPYHPLMPLSLADEIKKLSIKHSRQWIEIMVKVL